MKLWYPAPYLLLALKSQSKDYMILTEGISQRPEDWPDFIPLQDISSETHFLEGPDVLEVFKGILCVKSLEYANDTRHGGGNGDYVGLELPTTGEDYWQIALISGMAIFGDASTPPEHKIRSEINLGMVKGRRRGTFFLYQLSVDGLVRRQNGNDIRAVQARAVQEYQTLGSEESKRQMLMIGHSEGLGLIPVLRPGEIPRHPVGSVEINGLARMLDDPSLRPMRA